MTTSPGGARVGRCLAGLYTGHLLATYSTRDLAALAGTVLALLVISRSHAGDLRVTVTGIRSDAGALMVGLYDSAGRFSAAIVSSSSIGLLSDKERLIGVTMRATAGTQGIGFLQLPPGRYAVIVFHDENDGGLLDTNFFVIPNEGYTFGNNAAGFPGPPSFNAASVTVGSADQTIAITLSLSLIY